ncbi:MAG TPA: F0F1 ATP synthase subunit A [bacterium]|nr:F0F1 ATP synthase subunit A [bacterium]
MSQALSSTAQSTVAAPAATQAYEGAQGKPEMPEAVIAKGSPWQVAITGWITLAILFAFAAMGLSKLKKVPGGLQNAWEFTYEWLEDISVQVIGHDGPSLMPLFFSFFMWILFANLLGLIPYLASPTSRTTTTMALALITFGSTHVLGMRAKGVWGYWGHFFHIMDYRQESGFGKIVTFVLQFFLLPAIELVGELARPLSLTMRLFGNIYAKEQLLMILAALILQDFEAGGLKNYALMGMPLVLRPGVLILGVLVSVLQAVVFTALSMVYIGGAIAVHGEHVEGEEHAGHAPAH